MSWTDERVEKLKSLWNDGMSASQIAKDLGGVTRNAVIGKVHRLGLASRTSGGGSTAKTESASKTKKTTTAKKAEPTKAPAKKTAEAAKPKTKAKAAPQPAAKPKAEPEVVEAVEPETPAIAEDPSTFDLPSENQVDIAAIDRTAMQLGLLELTERTCKWPIGDPSRGEFYFCGQPAEAGKPYCKGHASAAYQPMSSRRDRERMRMRNQNRPAITR